MYKIYSKKWQKRYKTVISKVVFLTKLMYTLDVVIYDETKKYT